MSVLNPSIWVWIWNLNFWIHIDTKILPVLASFKFSLIIVILTCISFFKKIPSENYSWRPTRLDFTLTFLIVSILIFPLNSSLSSLDENAILNFPAYKALVKHLVIILLVGSSLASKGIRKDFINSNIVGVLALALILHYRYFWLGEARADGRPLLDQNIADPNFLATIFGTFIPLMIIWASNKKTRDIYLCAIFILFLIISLIITGSRMGIIALAIGLVSLMRLYKPKNPITFILVLIGSIVLSSIIFYNTPLGMRIFERFKTFDDESNSLRTKTLSAGLKVFMDAPIFGVGIDGVKHRFLSLESYARLKTEAIELNVHNTVIKLLAEHGVIGFTLFLLLPIYVISNSFGSKLTRKIAICIQSSIIILAANAMTLPLDIQDWLHQVIGCLMIVTLSNQSELYE